MYQGWISLETEREGRRARKNREEQAGNRHRNTNTSELLYAAAVVETPEMCPRTVICFSEVICCSIMGSLLKGT